MKEIVYIGADWCHNCRPIADTLIKRGVPFMELDVDDDAEFIEPLNIKNVPTIILYEDRKEIKRFVGRLEEKDIKEMLKFINN